MHAQEWGGGHTSGVEHDTNSCVASATLRPVRPFTALELSALPGTLPVRDAPP